MFNLVTVCFLMPFANSFLKYSRFVNVLYFVYSLWNSYSRRGTTTMQPIPICLSKSASLLTIHRSATDSVCALQLRSIFQEEFPSISVLLLKNAWTTNYGAQVVRKSYVYIHRYYKWVELFNILVEVHNWWSFNSDSTHARASSLLL